MPCNTHNDDEDSVSRARFLMSPWNVREARRRRRNDRLWIALAVIVFAVVELILIYAFALQCGWIGSVALPG